MADPAAAAAAAARGCHGSAHRTACPSLRHTSVRVCRTSYNTEPAPEAPATATVGFRSQEAAPVPCTAGDGSTKGEKRAQASGVVCAAQRVTPSCTE